VHSHLTDTHPPSTAPAGQEPASPAPARIVTRHPVWVHLAVLFGYIAAGIAVTWPHATYLAGKLPNTRDAGSYVWGFWWMARAVLHPYDPWLTHALAAPVGADLGMHALMPLAGVVMLPVTQLFGPSASFNLLSILMPGLLAYAMWRVAKLWVPSMPGSLAAGVFFGFSSMIDYQTWVHLNLAAGALFLPMTLEAAVRLRRRPGPGQAAVLGVVIGASLLVDQESAILVVLLATVAILPWVLFGPARTLDPTRNARTLDPTRNWRTLDSTRATLDRARAILDPIGAAHDAPGPPPDSAAQETSSSSQPPAPSAASTATPTRLFLAGQRYWRALFAVPPSRRGPQRARSLPVLKVKFALLGLAGLVALVVASPQVVAIVDAHKAGNPSASLSSNSYLFGIRLPDMFLPSPRITSFGLNFTHARDTATFGALATLLALVGLVLAWRRRNAWLLAAFWTGIALLAVGSDITLPFGTYTPFPEMLHGTRVSAILPFTWFVELPGLSSFREPSRIAELGLIPVALLAAYTVNWLRYHARYLLVVVFVLAVLESGLATPPGAGTMPTSLPALDRAIAADHSDSIVLDIPFGLRGGTGIMGLAFNPEAQVLATADGHPLADGLFSRVPTATIKGIERKIFYRDLLSAQGGHYQFSPAQLMIAAMSAARMHIGWVLLWVANKHLRGYLIETGFRYIYRADGVSVWRPAGYANAAIPLRTSA
jgi:hypothetical protein